MTDYTPQQSENTAQLTRAQREALHDALNDAFDRSGLTFLLRYKLNVDIDQIVPAGANDNEAIYHIVHWIEMAGQPHALIKGAREQNPTNNQLEVFAVSLPEGFLETDVDEVVLQKTAREYKSLPYDPKPDWHAQLEPYLKWVARQTRDLRLAPLDKSSKERAAYGLSHLFIELETQANRFEVHLDENTGAKFIGRDSSAISLINKNEHLLLLGDPGSGKTTLLRYIAHCTSRDLFEPEGDWLRKLKWGVFKTNDDRPQHDELIVTRYWSHKGLTPIFIELRNFVRKPFDANDAQAIWKYVAASLENEGLTTTVPALQREVLDGRALFLFDGVYEVPPKQRADVWRAIHAHDKGSCGGNRWVATCRQYSFDLDELPQSDIPVHTLQPLNERQIATFIDNWFAAAADAGDMGATEAHNKAAALKTATQRKHLRELADNPMLLTIMALVQTYHGELPEERAMLYQACIETLLLRWQKTKEEEGDDFFTQLGVKSLVLEQLLWEIGWTAHRGAASREDKADIPASEVMTIAADHLGSYGKAERFLAYTEQRAHLLVGRGGLRQRIYTFPHRTFQEYLAACHLASLRRFGHRARELAEESDTWRETLNLAAGTLTFNQKNPDKALDGIERVAPRSVPDADDETGWRRVWMAAEMLAVVGVEQALRDREVGQELVPHVRELVTQLVATGRLTPQQRLAAGEALAKLGDKRPGVCTLEPDMIPIVADLDFLMGDEKEPATVPQPYAIARYPVTNAQFRYFVDDGGYTEKWPHCWPPAGLDLRRFEGWKAPKYWRDPRLNFPNQPVVGISWYEAVAYTAWLAEVIGKPYRLPATIEWERAARHVDGRIYPWGERWRNDLVNSSETSIGRPSIVGMFPKSLAPCGVADIAGNVGEWGHDLCTPEHFHRFVFGGNYSSNHRGVRGTYRGCVKAVDRVKFVGFRCVYML